MHVDEFPDLDRQFADFPVDLVFGHLGYVPASKNAEEPGFRALLRLMRDGKAWVKLTAPYRQTMSAMPYPGVQPFAEALDRDLLELLARWVPDERTRRRILVDNPTALYRFAPIQSAM